jgi:hypothetical protein
MKPCGSMVKVTPEPTVAKLAMRRADGPQWAFPGPIDAEMAVVPQVGLTRPPGASDPLASRSNEFHLPSLLLSMLRWGPRGGPPTAGGERGEAPARGRARASARW